MASDSVRNNSKPHNNYMPFIALGVTLIVGLSLWVFGGSIGLDYKGKCALATSMSMIMLLVFEILPMSVTVLLWLGVIVILNVVPAEIAFNGYMDSIFWLMFGAFMLGRGSLNSGLAKRFTYKIMSYSGDSIYSLTAMIYVCGLLIGAFVPSGTSRIAIILPIYIGLLEIFKAQPNSNTSINLLINTKWGFSSGGTSVAWLTASNLNVVVIGVLATYTGYDVSWGQWVSWNFIPSVVLSLGLWATSHLTCRAENTKIEGGRARIRKELDSLGPITAAEKKMAAWLILAVGLWITKPLHGIDPSRVSLIIGCLLFAPKIGILTKKDIGMIPWNTLLFLGGVLAIGEIMKETGIDVVIVSTLIEPIMAPFAGFGVMGSYIGIMALVFLLHMIIPSGTGTVSALAPLVIPFAISKGINPIIVALVADMASRPWFFPFQSNPVLMLWPYAGVKIPTVAFKQIFQTIVYLLWIVLAIGFWMVVVPKI